MGKKKIGEFSNKPTPSSGDLFLIQDASTGIYYNVTKSQLLVIFGSGTPNFQQVTDTGSTTTNEVDFKGVVDGFYKVRIGTDGSDNGSVQVYDNNNNSIIESLGARGFKVFNNANSVALFEVIRDDGVDTDKVVINATTTELTQGTASKLLRLNASKEIVSSSYDESDFDYLLMNSFRQQFNY